MPNEQPLSFMVFPQLSLEIREFLYKVVLTYIQGIDALSGNFWKSATSSPPELKKIETWQTTHFENN